MFELLCKISFFIFMSVLYAYVISTIEAVIITLGYTLCVFSYYHFRTIKSAVNEVLSYVRYGFVKNDLNSSHVSNYTVQKKYNKINNSVIVPPLKNKIYVPICHSNNAFSNNAPAVFNFKFNNFVLNGDLPSPIVRSGLSIDGGYKASEKMKSIQNMTKSFNNSSSSSFRNDPLCVRNPFITCKKYNNNLDMETYMNVKSPGFTGRIVDKALESASYHIKYPAVKQISAYRFDKSTLRNLSKIPRVNSTPVVRIAPPDPINIHALNGTEKNLNKDAILQDVLKDVSRKRNYSQEETEKNNGTAKKSRKNDIKNFTIPQYKRSLEDKSRDVVEDKNKRRCDSSNRKDTKMVVYAPTMSSSNILNTYSKKRKSSKSNRNEHSGSTEKCRKINEGFESLCAKESLNYEKPKQHHLKSFNLPLTEELKLAEVSDQQLVSSVDEPVEDENIEFVRVATGKILNRTNQLYRRKLNSSKIDPISVIASDPEVVGEIAGTEDTAIKERLLQNLLSNIERKGSENEKVIFYKNSIMEEVAKKVEYDDPPKQVPNPLFTTCIIPDEDEITNEMNSKSEESSIDNNYSLRKKSPTATNFHHSTLITFDGISSSTTSAGFSIGNGGYVRNRLVHDGKNDY